MSSKTFFFAGSGVSPVAGRPTACPCVSGLRPPLRLLQRCRLGLERRQQFDELLDDRRIEPLPISCCSRPIAASNPIAL